MSASVKKYSSESSASLQNENTAACHTLEQLLSQELAQLTRIRTVEEPSTENHTIISPPYLPPPQNLFSHLFPITCGHCQKAYPSRQFYLAETRSFESENPSTASSTPSPLIFCDGSICEERICSCGETLTMEISAEDQRDGSYLGTLKRVLFDNCLQKLSETHSSGKEKQLKELLRYFFKSK